MLKRQDLPRVELTANSKGVNRPMLEFPEHSPSLGTNDYRVKFRNIEVHDRNLVLTSGISNQR